MSVLNGFNPEFEYAEECYQYLMESETKRDVFYKRSPEIDFREDLVQRIHVLCFCHKLSLPVKYLCIYIMDYFMDNHHISEDRLELTAICSLSIAAKADESDHKIPKYNGLFSESNPYSMSEVLEMEKLILKFFDWRLLSPTAATYIDYFYTKCLPEIELNEWNRDLVEKYLHKSHDLNFYKFEPSVIAASAIYCTRRRLNLEPIWSKTVQNITKYTFNSIEDCVQELLKFEFIPKPSKTLITIDNNLNDSGFIDI